MPLLKLKIALKTMQKGETIHLKVSDKTALNDIPKFCELVGHKLKNIEESDALVNFNN